VSVAQPDHDSTDHETQSGQCSQWSQSKGPTALRIALGVQLGRLRAARGISATAAGEAIRASAARIGRLELGRITLNERDVSSLLTLYGVRDREEREAFLSMTREANKRGWWHRYGSVLPSWFEMYLGLEQASSVIRTYEPQLVPGLLQTEDCARTLIRQSHPNTFNGDVERRVALRVDRQKLLVEPDAPSLWTVIDEAALWRLGGRSAMRAQIQRLIDLAELPNITLQVMPFGSGCHAVAGGPFSILRFAEPDLPDIVYLEQLTGAIYLDSSHEVSHYAMVMDRSCVQAKSPADSIRFLDSIVKEI
jgi:hypothetical protein